MEFSGCNDSHAQIPVSDLYCSCQLQVMRIDDSMIEIALQSSIDHLNSDVDKDSFS